MNKRSYLAIGIAFLILVVCAVPKIFGQMYDVPKDSTYTLLWDGEQYESDAEFVITARETLDGSVTMFGTIDTCYVFTCLSSRDYRVQARYPGNPLSDYSNTVYVVMTGYVPPPPVEVQIPATFHAWNDMRYWEGDLLVQDENGVLVLEQDKSMWRNITVIGGTYEVYIYFVGNLRVAFGDVVYDLWNDNRLKPIMRYYDLPAGTYPLKLTAFEDTRMHYGVENWTVRIDKLQELRLAPVPTIRIEY